MNIIDNSNVILDKLDLILNRLNTFNSVNKTLNVEIKVQNISNTINNNFEKAIFMLERQNAQLMTQKNINNSLISQNENIYLEQAKNLSITDKVNNKLGIAGRLQEKLNNLINKLNNNKGIESIESNANVLNKIQQIEKSFFKQMSNIKISKYLKDSINNFSKEYQVELQIKALINSNVIGDNAFDKVKQKASDLSKNTLFDTTSIIAGAGEISTYISDLNAVEKVMETLTNYATGMSGGNPVSQMQYVEYATQLGKALDGQYDGLAKKGFVLSEAQKEIIKNGDDMAKALVLDDVINQSWANLATTMNNTPIGIFNTLNKNLGELSSLVGSRLTPVALNFTKILIDNMPQIISIIDNVIISVSSILDVFANLFKIILDLGLPIINGLITGFTSLLPVILTAISVIAVYSAIIGGLYIKIILLKVAIILLSGALKLLNLILSLNPIALVISLVIVLITTFMMLNNKTDEMGNTFVNLFSKVTGGAYVFVNTVKNLFLSMVKTVLASISNVINAINKIPGINVDTSWLDNKVAEIEYKVKQSTNEKAFERGSKSGQDLANSLANLFTPKALALPDFGNLPKMGESNLHLEEIAKNTGDSAKSLNSVIGDMKYLRELAEKEVIARYTTQEIKFDVITTNTINNDVDLNGLVTKIKDGITDAMLNLPQGVY